MSDESLHEEAEKICVIENIFDIIHVISIEIKQTAKDSDQWPRDDFCLLFVPAKVIMT